MVTERRYVWNKTFPLVHFMLHVIMSLYICDPPVQCMLGNTVNKRVVCILLECNSYFIMFIYRSGTVNSKSFVGKVFL